MAKKDNGSLLPKVALREQLLKEIPSPVVMETNGGYGALFKRLYSGFRGVVFESNPKKAEALAEQRPTWTVYEADCEKALEIGAGFHLPVNFVDVDPYGEPWGILEALLSNAAKLPDLWGLAVNDGLKRYLMLGRAWKSLVVKPFVRRLGNEGVVAEYPTICREIMSDMMRVAGFEIVKWTVHSCGHGGQMTHYGAILERRKAPVETEAL